MVFKSYRIRCPQCGNVMDVKDDVTCKCGTLLTPKADGMIRIYRMGSPIGVAAGFGIYLNNTPVGHIGNKQTVNIPVPFGDYNLHVASGFNRRCKDVVITVSPENPVAGIKVSMKMGAWSNTFILTPADSTEIPD